MLVNAVAIAKTLGSRMISSAERDAGQQLVGALCKSRILRCLYRPVRFHQRHDDDGGAIACIYGPESRENCFSGLLHRDTVEDRLPETAFRPASIRDQFAAVDHHRTRAIIGFGGDQLLEKGWSFA